MTTRRSLLVTIPLLMWLLAACSSSPQGPAMSAAQTGAAIEDLYQAGATVSSATAWDQLPAAAIAAVGGISLPPGATAGALPRGVYVHDQLAAAWVRTGDSDDLELNWLHEAVAYRLTVDWDATAPTDMVTLSPGESHEVPTGATLVFVQDGVEVGESSMASGWTANQCGFDEPNSAAWQGDLGDANASLTLDRLGFTFLDTAGTATVTAEVEATARAGADSLSAYLELSGSGQLARDAECAIVDFAPDAGSVALGVAISAAGAQHSLDFHTAFSEPEYQGGALSGIGLDGSLRLDGVLAAGFAGALNDANGNSIPGDELLLTFADSQTMTLEEFLIDQVGWGPLAALRLLAR